MDLIYKISFDIKYLTLHQVVDWLVENDLNTPIDFKFNNHYYIFTLFDKNDIKYIGYESKLKIIDTNKGIIISYLIPPNNLIKTI